jgi:hypothetical protein
MVATRDKHRAIVAEHCEPGETLLALVHVNVPSSGGGHESPSARNVSRYTTANNIVERGVNGVYDLHDIWLGLTERRLLIFRGSWFTFAHKPKRFLTAVPIDTVTLRWRDEAALRVEARLYHFAIGDEEHLVRLGDVDEEADRFVSALGGRATLLRSD